MSSEITSGVGSDVVYPESDGKPMADNTLQWDWMVKIVGELRDQYRGQEVFVAGDLFWYPVEGDPGTVAAPDAMVAFGRPPGYRGSYKQWDEGHVAPQVVFEVLSPSNTPAEMAAKRRHYDRHGVEEYYVIDPYEEGYEGYVRHGSGGLRAVPARKRDGWVSPRLGVRFVTKGGLRLVGPDGREFQTHEEFAEGFREELRRTQEAFEDERERRIEAERDQEQLARERDAVTLQRDAAARDRDAATQERDALTLERDALARERDAAAARAAALVAAMRAAGLNPDDFLRPAG